jgi:hypothetical protein
MVVWVKIIIYTVFITYQSNLSIASLIIFWEAALWGWIEEIKDMFDNVHWEAFSLFFSFCSLFPISLFSIVYWIEYFSVQYTE